MRPPPRVITSWLLFAVAVLAGLAIGQWRREPDSLPHRGTAQLRVETYGSQRILRWDADGSVDHASLRVGAETILLTGSRYHLGLLNLPELPERADVEIVLEGQRGAAVITEDRLRLVASPGDLPADTLAAPKRRRASRPR
ncbi:MAG: hypothetical protein K2X03_03275 [Bryobacteraceae bacterium]|nr:hypothetical protein [Bryobacteraceae bacterium]